MGGGWWVHLMCRKLNIIEFGFLSFWPSNHIHDSNIESFVLAGVVSSHANIGPHHVVSS